MSFVYKKWKLYKGNVKLNDGRSEITYLFSRRKPRKCKPCGLPEGYTIAQNERTGLPFLEKITTKSRPTRWKYELKLMIVFSMSNKENIKKWKRLIVNTEEQVENWKNIADTML